MHDPVRTCIGCRGQAHKSELLRLVWMSTIVVDQAQVEPGRGAYLHRTPDCLDNAIRRRAAGRALHVAGVDSVDLAVAVVPHLRRVGGAT